MNIGVDIRTLMSPYRTGVGEYTNELLSALFKLDKINNYYLFFNSYTDVSKNIPKWNQENVEYVGSGWPNKIFNFRQKIFNGPKLDQIISRHELSGWIKNNYGNENGKDIKLDYFFSPNIHFTSLSYNVKQILTVHDLSFEFFPKTYSLRRRLWHKILNPKQQCQRASRIIVPSYNTKRDVINHFKIPEEKIKVIYPGLSSSFVGNTTSDDYLNTVREKYSLPENFILFLGTVEPRKNIWSIIEAYKKLRQELGGQYSLIIAGPIGWRCRNILDEIESTMGIKHIGYVDADHKPALYALADLFVYPSLYEGFGFPVIEAMASQTPVITSNTSSLPEVVGSAAYLVNPNNVNEIANGMKIILEDNNGVKEVLIKKGLEQTRKFVWQKAAKDFLSLIV